MEQFFERVTSEQDAFDKLGSYIPGFKGYVERQTRRDADKLLRDTVARRFDEHWSGHPICRATWSAAACSPLWTTWRRQPSSCAPSSTRSAWPRVDIQACSTP